MKTKEKKRKNSWLMCRDLVILYPYWLLFSFVCDDPALSQNLNPASVKSEVRNSCAEQSLETLTSQLMLDLPNYTNRVTQRSRKLKRQVDSFSYILVAGKPDLSPLPLNPGISNSPEYDSTDVKQVFFTTLERRYINNTSVELQQFHRLFLTKTNSGWELVMMFSQTGTYPKKELLAPLRDSSNSAIAQGVKLWLRDCYSRKELTIDN